MDVKFSQSRNDMYWTVYAGSDGTVRWTGYDDAFWWNNVSKSSEFIDKTGPVSGKIYRLDPVAHTVSIVE